MFVRKKSFLNGVFNHFFYPMKEEPNLIPFFKWGQDKTHVYIGIDLVGVQNEMLDYKENYFKWSAMHNERKYELEFELAGLIKASTFHRESHTLPEFAWEKKDSKQPPWCHIMKANEKHKYKGRSRVDFVKWQDEEEPETSSFGLGEQVDMDMSELMAKLQEPEKVKCPES